MYTTRAIAGCLYLDHHFCIVSRISPVLGIIVTIYRTLEILHSGTASFAWVSTELIRSLYAYTSFTIDQHVGNNPNPVSGILYTDKYCTVHEIVTMSFDRWFDRKYSKIIRPDQQKKNPHQPSIRTEEKTPSFAYDRAKYPEIPHRCTENGQET